MPFSFASQISQIVGVLESANPNSILDVGVGMGQYGFLARTRLENVDLFDVNSNPPRQKRKDEWRIRIDGIEGCAGYVTPVHDYAYNNLIIGEALTELAKLPDQAYELVMAIDILEHFEKPEARRFLSELQRVSKQRVLISTPKAWMPQEVELNPYENHRSHWTESDLRQAGFTQVLPNAVSWIALWNRGG